MLLQCHETTNDCTNKTLSLFGPRFELLQRLTSMYFISNLIIMLNKNKQLIRKKVFIFKQNIAGTHKAYLLDALVKTTILFNSLRMVRLL